MNDDKIKCWVCSSSQLKLYKKGSTLKTLNSNNFAITDYDYGKTGTLYKCTNCGFIQTYDISNVLNYYNDLIDPEYENSREERSVQAQKILQNIISHSSIERSENSKLKLLDIGAGSGILVGQANEIGFEADGIEPSEWLTKQANKKNLKVYQGTLPHPDITSKYQVVTLIDVIEHVDDPKNLVYNAVQHLDSNGVLVIITPDISSFTAKLLRDKWWHFRIAHVGYFNKKTLTSLLNSEGLIVKSLSRPSWYFKISYLYKRIMQYLPLINKLKLPNFIGKLVIPLNLGDSIMVICKKNDF